MAVDDGTRPQLLLSLLSWVAVLGLYFVTKWRGGSVEAEKPEPAVTGAAQRVLVLGNQTIAAPELLDALRSIDAEGSAQYWVCVPANPVDTGQAEYKGAVFIWAATQEAAQRRLDYTLTALRTEGLRADGALGDYRPLRALADAVADFQPDRLVICTLPEDRSTWLRFDVVDRARSTYDIPVTHVIANIPVPIP
jgi:GABA permease